MFNTDKDLSLDFRLADFKLKAGDQIIFQEWVPKTKQYTGREYSKKVKKIIKCKSPTRYWSQKQLKKHGLYLMEFKD